LKITVEPDVDYPNDELAAELDSIRSKEDVERFISRHISVQIDEIERGNPWMAVSVVTPNKSNERVIRIRGDNLVFKYTGENKIQW
jgi:hypothetical protein